MTNSNSWYRKEYLLGLGGLGGGAADFGGDVPTELPTGANDLSPASPDQASADLPAL